MGVCKSQQKEEKRAHDYSLRFFPDLQHFYKQAPPGLNSFEAMQLEGETDERVSEAISKWLNTLTSPHYQRDVA